MSWATKPGKRVPQALRLATLERDGHQCVATLRDGNRCRETTNLEADHIVPDHLGGPTTLSNLQTLCWWHHKRKTQEESRAARAANPKPGQRHPRERHPGLI